MYSLRLRSCRSMGAFIMSPLPPMLSKSSCAAGPLCSTGITLCQRSYGPGRHRLAFGRFPGETGYTAYLAPAISAWGEDGFSSCLACPCHRAVPTTPPEGCASTVSLRRTLLPSLDQRELGLQDYFVGATRGFTRVTARWLAHHPDDGFVSQLHQLRFLHPCDSSYGALTSTPAGLTPAEHASLRWTHSGQKTNPYWDINILAAFVDATIEISTQDLVAASRTRKGLRSLESLIALAVKPLRISLMLQNPIPTWAGTEGW